MLLCGVACIGMMGSVTGQGNTIMQLLNGGVVGAVILGFCVATVIV